MNKFLSLALAVLMAFCQPAFSADWENGALISAEQLDNSPTSYTSSALTARGAKKIGFYVAYDETEVGASVSGSFTVETSFDGSNWITASFYDFAGGTTFQTSESFTADGRYYAWLSADSAFQFVRVKMTGTNTDADDIIVTTVNYVIEK